MSAAKVALGKRCFPDPRLSITENILPELSFPERAFTDGLPRSRGATGEALPPNAPTLFNVAYNARLAGRTECALEQQMRGPFQ
jgi:cytochrome c peroxidase